MSECGPLVRFVVIQVEVQVEFEAQVQSKIIDIKVEAAVGTRVEDQCTSRGIKGVEAQVRSLSPCE